MKKPVDAQTVKERAIAKAIDEKRKERHGDITSAEKRTIEKQITKLLSDVYK